VCFHSNSNLSRQSYAIEGGVQLSQIRLGYACVNLSLGKNGLTSRTCRLRNATRSRLEILTRENLDGLSQVLRWNVAQRIKFFRISSGVVPLASHPRTQWPWKKVLARELADIGYFIRSANIRVSMHPGQYVVLNSPYRSVVRAAKAELTYHADFLDQLNLDKKHKITLHAGGLYSDRDASMRRFRKEFTALPNNVRSRLVLENDERSYGAEDVLTLAEALGIPMVFDYLHQIALSGQSPNENLLKRVCESWSASDGRPEFHYSTQKPGSREGSHADMIDVQDFLRFLKVMPSRNVDLMLEAKAKDLALLRLRQQLLARPKTLRGWSVT
jgi:UV DNA damage endonuclease